MEEFVCADGRMSVNGICPVSSYPGYQDPTKNTVTTPVIDTNQNVSGGDGNNNITKDYSKNVKSNFQWDFDKVGNKIQNFGDTIKGNIDAYDKYVEDNLGISKNVSNVLRAGAVVKGVAAYGLAGALVPFAIPFMAGGALNAKQKKENERITNITMQDPQGTINTPPARIMNIQPTPQDIYRGGGGDRPSSPAKTSQGVTSAQHAAFRS
jgi:hypothetical protein